MLQFCLIVVESKTLSCYRFDYYAVLCAGRVAQNLPSDEVSCVSPREGRKNAFRN